MFKDSVWSLLLKSLITCSTLVLIGLIILYHIIVVRVRCTLKTIRSNAGVALL